MGAELSFKGIRTEIKSKREAILEEKDKLFKIKNIWGWGEEERKEQLRSVGAELRENN